MGYLLLHDLTRRRVPLARYPNDRLLNPFVFGEGERRNGAEGQRSRRRSVLDQLFYRAVVGEFGECRTFTWKATAVNGNGDRVGRVASVILFLPFLLLRTPNAQLMAETG